MSPLGDTLPSGGYIKTKNKMTDLIDKLHKLDIPKREGEIYFALLHKKEFTAPEISKITSISRTKSYEILQNLVKKGLCNESYRNGIKVFKCINPNIVLDNILSNYEKKKEIAESLRVGLVELFNKNGGDDVPLDYIEVITDKEQIKEKFLTIERNSQKELLAFNKAPYTVSNEDNLNEEADKIKNNIKVKGLYEYNDLTPDEMSSLINVVEILKKLGEEVRIVKELPYKLIICDENTTMMALNDRISLKPSRTTMIVDHPTFAKAQKKIFASYWKKGITIEEFKRKINSK